MEESQYRKPSTEPDKNFLGTYLTENGSTAVVISRSAMVVDGKKKVIWVGFTTLFGAMNPQFTVWDFNGISLNRFDWNLKEAVREKAY